MGFDPCDCGELDCSSCRVSIKDVGSWFLLNYVAPYPTKTIAVGSRVRHRSLWRMLPFTVEKITAGNPIMIDVKSADGKIALSGDISHFDLWDLEVSNSSTEKTLPICIPHEEGSTPIRLAEKNLESWFVCKKCGSALRKFDDTEEEQDLFDFSVKF